MFTTFLFHVSDLSSGQWAFICPLSTSMPKILDLSPKLSWENWFCGFFHSDFCKIYNFTLSIPNGCWWVSFSDSFSWIWIWIWICQTAWTHHWGIHSNSQKCNRVKILRTHAHFARQKCAFLCILTLSIPDGCLWVSFSDSFSWGIHSNRQKCNRVQKLRPHADFARQKCAFLCILMLSIPDGCWWLSFSESFSWGIHSNSKKCNRVKILCPHTHIASQKCAFLWILTLSIPDGWWWVSFSDSFSCGIHSNSKKCNQVQKLRPLAQKMRISMHTYTFYSRWLLMAVDVSFSIVFPGELISDFTFAHFSFSRNFDFVKFISPICFISQLITLLYGLIYPLTRFMPKIMKFCRKLKGTGVMAFFFLLFFFRKKILKMFTTFLFNVSDLSSGQWAFICSLSTSMPKILDFSPKLSWET